MTSIQKRVKDLTRNNGILGVKVISMINKQIIGFPLWSEGKEYEVLRKEKSTILLADDLGRLHWMRIGENFKYK